MSWQDNLIFESFKAWWKIANKLPGLFVENVENNWCVGSIFGSQFHFLLMFTQYLVSAGNVAVFWCVWRFRRWYSSWEAWCWWTVFCCEELDAWYPDCTWRSSTEDGILKDRDCMTLDNKKVVVLETCWKATPRSGVGGECTLYVSQVDLGWRNKTEGPGGEVHFTGYPRSMESSSMAAIMLFIRVGRHRGSQWPILRMDWCMTTRYFGGFSNFRMTERDISANACEVTMGVSKAWYRRQVRRGTSSQTRETSTYSSQFTSSTNRTAILSSPWRSSLFEVLANAVFCGLSGSFPHECRNGY